MVLSDRHILVGYCGVYCGACAWYKGKWREYAEGLLRLMDAYPVMRWEDEIPFDYEEFEKGLNWLINDRRVCQGCRSGDNLLTCEIQDCVKNKGVDFCYQCEDFPCDKLFEIQRDHPDNIENIMRIQMIGIEEWIQEEENKVKDGYIHHLKET